MKRIRLVLAIAVLAMTGLCALGGRVTAKAAPSCLGDCQDRAEATVKACLQAGGGGACFDTGFQFYCACASDCGQPQAQCAEGSR